ncbi:TonB-dependent receptor [Chitinophaga cymbidii]|uniref:SusC/RagA family TonB-linked outer membrane protein n=1 Tax=Chitinophaga cymbidii TaxID=1096750 RepID=A0A512RJ45_9BACT|nr:TonB-dependent receptor [Chitinophaga cymbidii]GEP95705.1 SusC/RagA family TonB-linked outer membrane protein [Chitinophaga cymbidii]
MKLLVVLLTAACLQVSAHVSAQIITFSGKNVSLTKVFEEIRKQGNYQFLYNTHLLKQAKKIDLDVRNMPVKQVLDICMKDQLLTYVISGNTIVIKQLLPRSGSDPVRQDVRVQGRVVTQGTGEALPGVTVQVKGVSGRGTATDVNGKYSINVPDNNAVLVFSFLGYATKEEPVNGRTDISVELQAVGSDLETVVVVSYGAQSQRSITGSVTKVSTKEVQDIPAAEFGQKLQGRVAGLQVSQVSGRPGQGMTFRIRGASSLRSGNQPLIVIDGQPLTGDNINVINPDEIESYSILKDASATALYGSRAANGVVIITTKQARAGRTNMSFNTYYGWQTVPQRGRPDMMNAREFAEFMNGFYEDKIRYENWTDPSSGLAEIPEDYRNPSQYGEGTDWYDALLRTAPMSNYSLNVSTGTEKVLSSTTLTYFNQQGVMYNTGMQRFSLRSNNEFRPNDRLKIGLNLAPTYQNDHNTRSSTLDNNRQAVSGALISSPLIPAVNPDGSLPTSASSYGMYKLPNFYQQLLILNQQQKTLRLLANLYGELELLPGLTFRTTFNTDLIDADLNIFSPSTTGRFGAPPPQPASASAASSNTVAWLSENMLTYKFKLGGQHNFDVLAGYSAQKWEQNNRYITGTNFANDRIPWISGAATTTGTTNNAQWSMLSWYGRVNYAWKDKYYVTANIRQDGSSRFGDNRKWGYFPSASAAWIVSEEPFFPKSSTLSHLKIRGSYGLTGNNNIGDYTQTALLSGTNYTFSGSTLAPGQSITQMANDDLTWETSKQLDLGLEMTLLNDRITFSYDYYRKTTEDLLYQWNVPYASGYPSVAFNVGSFRMWGHEFQVNTRNLTGELEWNTTFNIAFNDNKVVDLQAPGFLGGTGTYNDYNRTAVGRRIGEFWGYVFDGIYMTEDEYNRQPKHVSSAVGSTRMKDVNGDGVITAGDKDYIGNPNPRMIFGMANDLRYKNFDFSVVVAGQTGNQIMNTNLQNLVNIDGIFNVTKDMAHRWRSEENPGNGKVPRTLANTTELYRLANSNWVFDGDYLTVKNITLGYTLDLKRLRYLQSARFYASVQQAFVFTRYPGQNPEVNDTRDQQISAGLDNGSFPIPRTVMIGANINF